MKRDGLALIIHPYKNVLLKKDKLRKYLDQFAHDLIQVVTEHPNFRANLTLPGYLLQHLDPILLSRLNDIRKEKCLEWLTPGYTEPLISFSPLWLSKENITQGIKTFDEITGCKPWGYMPSFSNWEPSLIEPLRNNGIHYTILSRSVLQEESRNYCGYWITEQAGHTMIVIPSYDFHFHNAPAQIQDWMDNMVEESINTSQSKMVVLHYLCPLVSERSKDAFRWIHSFAESLDTLLIKYQMTLLSELITLTTPLGLQSIRPSFLFKYKSEKPEQHDSNLLYAFDSLGILQRKMVDVASNICSHEQEQGKELQSVKEQLYLAQDCNRYLPNKQSGFEFIKDRMYTFSKMVAIERELLKKDKIRGGQIRIADFLKNGSKSIIMSNRSFKIYIDHKNGGQIFELDYRLRSVNLFSGYNPTSHKPPRIIVAGDSCTSFIDYFLKEDCQRAEFLGNPENQIGDFYNGQFEYKIKKTSTSVKAVMTRQGSIRSGDKLFPLNIEKVFGLEKDKPELTFGYQLANHSLTDYTVKFAVRLNFSLPGASSQQAALVCNDIVYDKLVRERLTLENIREFSLRDHKIGTEIQFVIQKPVTLWSYPISQLGRYQGTSIIITTPVSLPENSAWSLLGRMICKKIRLRGSFTDVI